MASDTSAANNDDDSASNKAFECNICLDTAREAVVSMCGHLFCWPCLHRWMETQQRPSFCPVCKAAIDKDKVIPLYGRDNPNPQDPREKVPPRPAGQRTEPDPNPGNFFSNLFSGPNDGGFQMSFGIGAFPFTLFSTTFNIAGGGGHFMNSNNPGGSPNAANRGGGGGGTTQELGVQSEEAAFMSKVFLVVACVCIFWLLFA